MLSLYPYPSPTSGGIGEQQAYARALSIIYSGYKKQQKKFFPQIHSWPLPSSQGLGLSTTSRLIGSGKPNHPSRRNLGQRDVLNPTDCSQRVPQSPGSRPPPTQVAAHGKHAKSLESFKNTFIKKYIVERTNKAETRLEEQRKRRVSENLWTKYSWKSHKTEID